jgi:hypothetical protein
MMLRYPISDPFVSGKAPPAVRRTASNLGLRDVTARHSWSRAIGQI